MLSTTSRPNSLADSASVQAASTASSPASVAAVRMSTNWRSPSSCPASRRRIPVAERIAVAQCPRLARQHGQVMPGIVGGLAATKAAAMLRDNLAVAPDDNALGINPHLRGAPRRFDRDAVAIVVEAHQAALRHRDFDLAEAVKRPPIGDQARPLGLEHLPNRLVALLGMHARAGLGETARFQPGIELGVVGKVQPRCEQALAHVADLVLDLALLPTRRRRTRHGLDQVM